MSRLGRIAFLGTAEFGVPLLARVADHAHELLVVSQPDRPAGRGLATRRSPVTAFAGDHGLRLETPARLRSDAALAMLREFGPDGILLVAYGQLVPPELLDAFPLPALNVHPSLLPRHRGAAPVAATILSGDDEAGLSLMVMTPRLDAGPIAEQWRVPLSGDETAPLLEARLASLAASVVPPLLARWMAGGLQTVPQDEGAATLVRPFARDDGRIDWTRDAIAIDRQVRALQPWPGAWTTADGRRLHIRSAHAHADATHATHAADAAPGSLLDDAPRVACGSGSLGLDVVQPEGRPPMSAADWRRGLGRQVARLNGRA